MSKEGSYEDEFFGILTKDLFCGINESVRFEKSAFGLLETELIIWNPTIIIRSF